MRDREQPVFIFKLVKLIQLFFGAIEALIGLTPLLKLLGANKQSASASFADAQSAVFVWPFGGLTATPSAGNITLELPARVVRLI